MKACRFLAASAVPLLLCGCLAYPGQGTTYPGPGPGYGYGYGYGAPAPVYAGYGAPAPAPYAGYDPRGNRSASDWYREHPVERQAQLMQCRQSPAVALDQRCMSAIQADRQEVSRERATEVYAPRAYGVPVMLGPIVTPQLK